MIVYTSLNKLTKTFAVLQEISSRYSVTLKSGLVTSDLRYEFYNNPKQDEKAIFWFSKSNNTQLKYYRVRECLERIYLDLIRLEKETN